MTDLNIANIRKEYKKNKLSRSDVPDNPMQLFEKWLQEAITAQVNEPTAVIVGTSTPDGHPSTRTVLLKELINGKFVFYTNYDSRKGKQLTANPYVSLSFVWHQLERQVHVEGKAEKVPAEESDSYFNTRPYKSRIGARISPQSQPIASRMQLMRSFVKESIKLVGQEIKRPEHWGGFAVTPIRIEFWQGRENRLHDRILYTLQENGEWKIERLAP